MENHNARLVSTKDKSRQCRPSLQGSIKILNYRWRFKYIATESKHCDENWDKNWTNEKILTGPVTITKYVCTDRPTVYHNWTNRSTVMKCLSMQYWWTFWPSIKSLVSHNDRIVDTKLCHYTNLIRKKNPSPKQI